MELARAEAAVRVVVVVVAPRRWSLGDRDAALEGDNRALSDRDNVCRALSDRDNVCLALSDRDNVCRAFPVREVDREFER